MELPAALKLAVERVLERVPLETLRHDAQVLSERYRAETRDGRLHMSDERATRAYLAARLPATYAAVRASLAALAQARPDFQPTSLLDIGAGPGTMLWAAHDLWPELANATLIEASEPVRRIGATLATELDGPTVEWRAGDAVGPAIDTPQAELVSAAYLLDELSPAAITGLVDRMWALTANTLLIVEPGTPAGWRRIVEARARLVTHGAHVVAPCPHQAPCPLVAPDWCHFARRVARSRLHRQVKNAEVPWEDEKYIFIAASRRPGEPFAARVLAPPKAGSGRIQLKLCEADGRVAERLVSKRDGALFKQARRAGWGDRIT
jgi:ribosomal protein RSM22 (predicted rRNA methylase)